MTTPSSGTASGPRSWTGCSATCSGEAVRVDDEGQRSLRDVRDHILQVAERLSGYRELLHIL